MYQEAGSGVTISPITKIEELIPRFRDFPAIAQGSAAAYETELATYDTLPLPLPPPEEQENFEFALRDTRDQKLRFMQVRNDLTFALRNPQFFAQLPPVADLQNAIGIYTRLVNAALAHASELVAGRIHPPSTFDPSALSPPLVEPAPIPLPRAVVHTAATIRVPSFIGMEAIIIREALRQLGLGTVDQVLAGITDSDEDGNPHPLGVARDILEFLQLSRQGGPRIQKQLPPSVFPASIFVVQTQFPAAGELISPDDTLILQIVEIEVK